MDRISVNWNETEDYGLLVLRPAVAGTTEQDWLMALREGRRGRPGSSLLILADPAGFQVDISAEGLEQIIRFLGGLAPRKVRIAVATDNPLFEPMQSLFDAIARSLGVDNLQLSGFTNRTDAKLWLLSLR